MFPLNSRSKPIDQHHQKFRGPRYYNALGPQKQQPQLMPPCLVASNTFSDNVSIYVTMHVDILSVITPEPAKFVAPNYVFNPLSCFITSVASIALHHAIRLPHLLFYENGLLLLAINYFVSTKHVRLSYLRRFMQTLRK